MTMPNLTTSQVITNVLRVESEALKDLSNQDPTSLLEAATLIHESNGPLIVAGIGKSGHIGRKISSTFKSLGKPAVFLQAAEASHGDLGIVGRDSVVLVLSNSGETLELGDVLAYCQQNEIPVISITADKDSTLGRSSKIALTHGKVNEACINGLAPTTSTTLALAIGDALAVGVSHLQQFEPDDFRRYHPGGKLGNRLLTVSEIMHGGTELPMVDIKDNMSDVVCNISEKGFGVAIVYDGEIFKGVITDGDMRRHVKNLFQSEAGDLISDTPAKSIDVTALASEALKMMTLEKVTCLVVNNNDGIVVGLITIHDCLVRGVTE